MFILNDLAYDRLPESVTSFLETIASFERVEKLILFGSRSYNDHEERSDIDIAIVFSTFEEYQAATMRDIASSAKTLYKVSITSLDSMPDLLRNRVIETGKVIYEREKAQG